MKLDFVVKPLNIYKIQNVIRKAASSAKHDRPNPAARSSRRSQFKFKPIAAIQYLKSKIMKGIGHNLFTWLHRQKNHPLKKTEISVECWFSIRPWKFDVECSSFRPTPKALH